MKISRLSVQRPVFTIMAALIVVILGAVAWTRLPIDLMPDITYPTLSISAEYENASPEEVEELITRPLEEALTAVPGVEEVSSVSAEGRSNVRVTFTWGTDLDAAANDVRDRLDRVMPNLPEDTDKPRLRKYDLASFPILILGASSDLDPVQMRKILDDQVKYRIERVPGVAVMDIYGGLDREIHVNLNPEKMKALGLPLDLILTRIKEGNINLPAGTLERGSLDVRIRTPGIYTSLEEIGETVIALRDGVPVQLREIATIEDSWEKVTRIVRVNGRPGVRLVVNKQSGKNTVEVASGVLKEIEKINQDIPQILITPIIDTSDYIQRSISSVGSSIMYGGILAIIVLLLFLRNIPSTAIIATAIPISIIAAFGLIYFGGFTLNLMTLGGLALGIGMLVDNAIVVIENIYRHRESGHKPRQAAITGSEEVAAAVIASTLTTLAVFLPMIFVRGMSGIMFKQLSFVVGFSLICSLAVALTLVPMLASRMITSASVNARLSRGGRTAKTESTAFNLKSGMEERYRKLLHLALGHRKTVIIGAVLLMIGSLALIPLVGVEFMPTTDESEVRVYGEMEVGTNLDVVAGVFRKIEDIIKKEVPEVKNTVTLVGGSGWRAKGSHSGEIRIALKPESERNRSSAEIAQDLRKKLSNIPGMTVRTREGQGLFILRMGTQSGEKVQVEIRGHDMEKADVLARKVKSIVENVDGVTDVQISRESGSPEELIIVDRQKAADMKLSVSQIANMLKTVLTGTGASNYRESGDEYRILVKLEEAEQKTLREILDLTLVNSDGEPVVLRNLVKVIPRTGPVLIERKDQERIINVSANISGRDMGSIIADTRKGLRTVPLPRDFSIMFGGDYEEQQKAFRELLLGFVLALILVYMVMASLYESLRDPFVVMFSVPLAIIGVILMLLLTGTTFNVQSYIGCIMLGGIVVNNAILLVDHINLLRRKEGMTLLEAIEEAGRRRLRPILMTAATTMLALVPLAIGLGEGGEAQAPMARAVIGGLLSSTLITLVFVPVVYAVFESRLERKKRAKEVLQEDEE
ncbi:MAG TPA: efflux RND transporter permease subunit [Desulfobacteraceae bacterium]|nr:efflux RND transporter permease subunit [Desulfobacteraceae bacterium]HPJ67267.1 efflux RND transporter permease subunit [Desulfobacteraceae bacterium]HPQ27353.1 efflux RND transporter permease subunit [Desulfobacteraceae bacterium]